MLSPLRLGALWTLVSIAAFLASNTLVRHLSTKLPALEMATFRSAAGLILLLVAWRAVVQLRTLRDPWLHLVRGAVGSISLLAMVHALSSLPLALVSAVLYTRILLVIPMGRLFLRERTGRDIWLAASVGIGGALIALWPRLSSATIAGMDWGMVSVVIATLAGAGSQICMRRLSQTNPTSVVVLVASILMATIIAGPAIAVGAAAPPLLDAPLLAGMGLCSVAAQWCAVRGYRYGSPARLMPLTLVEMPAAALLGYALFGEVPSVNTVAGSALIMVAALYVTGRGAPKAPRVAQQIVEKTA